MIVTFAYPSTHRYGGGVAALYHYADGLAGRGHDVHFIHGPEIEDSITDPAEITWHRFHPGVTHHIAAGLDDPMLPAADVILQPDAPRRLGEPMVVIQGYKLLSTNLERPAFRAPCPKLCVATWLTEIGQEWGSRPEQMLHVPLGLDHESFQAPDADAHRPIDVAMLYTHHPVKGGDDGLAALAALRQRRPDLRVQLFGIVAPPELPAWAPFLTGLDHRGLAEHVYRQAKVFLQPSWREGFGLTAVEAMACGAALVTTDNGGSRDYAFPGRTAEVVAVHDPEGLCDAMDRLLIDEGRRRREATAGAELATTFTWDRAAEVLEGHLERYLSDPAALQHSPRKAPMFLEDTW